MEWLTCFCIVNLVIDKNSQNARNISKINWCVTIILTKPLRFVKTYENVSKDWSQMRTHGYSMNLIIKFTVKNKMNL